MTFLFLYRDDTQAEIDLVCRIAEASGASAAVQCNHWSRGGRGSVELAQAVKKVASQNNHFQFLYNLQVRPCEIICKKKKKKKLILQTLQ